MGTRRNSAPEHYASCLFEIFLLFGGSSTISGPAMKIKKGKKSWQKMAEEGWWQASQETVPGSLQFPSRLPLFHSAFPFFP